MDARIICAIKMDSVRWVVFLVDMGRSVMGDAVIVSTSHAILLQVSSFEPSHEIMVLFVLRKLILQTLMRSYPVEARCLIFGQTLRQLPYSA